MNRESSILRSAVSALVLACGFVVSSVMAEEQVVANDPFSDGMLYQTPIGGDAQGLVWFSGNQEMQTVEGDLGLGEGRALHLKSKTDFATVATPFPRVPLAAEGDTLTVEFDFRLPVGLSKTGGGLRFGLYDSGGTLRTSVMAAHEFNDDTGYGVSTNAGGTAGMRDSDCFREAAGDGVLGGPAPAGIQQVGSNQRGPAISADGAKHHLRLTVKRGAEGALEMVCQEDDRQLTAMSESAANLLTSSFDEFALGFAGPNNLGEITIDNFKVTATTQAPLASMKARRSPAAAPALREWTDPQGRKIKATLIAFDAAASNVKIRLEDGREFVVPLGSFSAADVAYVQQADPSLAALEGQKPAGWVAQYPAPIKNEKAKLESGRSLLKNLHPGHPRLMMRTEDWPRLKELVASDPIAKKIYAQVVASGTEMLTAPPLEHVLPDGVRLLGTSRDLVGRVYTLGVLSRLDGDPKWAARAIKEVLNVCSFKDWNPSHFLDVGEMAHGVGVGYDWFYDQLSDTERSTIRKALVEMAFQPAQERYAMPNGWHRSEHLNNWNHVCNGGLIAAALAVADDEPRSAGQILDAAMESLEPAMNLYLPDGAWDEGPGYWEYATNYVITAAEALRTATGSDGGISQSPGLNLGAEFMQHLMGGTGKSFNFADGGANDFNRTAFLWLGKTYRRPDYSSMLKSHVDRSGASSKASTWFGSAHALLWFHRESGTQDWQQAPLDRVFRRIEVVSLRTGWDDNAISVSAKGGDNRFSHGNLDLGTFVIDALGVRWATELGADNYGLEGYFGKERFTHYRTSSAGQNVLTWNDQNQALDGTGFVETFLSTPERGQAVLDLSKGFPQARQVRRGVRLIRGATPSILIQDEITQPGKDTLVWGMHTQAAVALQGREAILSKSGRKLKASILSPASAVFEVKEVQLEPPSYPTPDTRKLLIRVAADTENNLTIAVRFSLEGDPSPAPEVEPLQSWAGQPVPH